MELKFKTNLKCKGCVDSVKPTLDEIIEINDWKVDLNSENRILTVEGESIPVQKILESVNKLGYQFILI